jgi:gluconokinase
MSDFILAVDIGTSATKAVLFDTAATQIAVIRQPYPIHTPHPGWSEQEPAVIFEAVVAAMAAITDSMPEKGRIAGIAFSSQLYSILAVGPGGHVLTPSLTWSDTRSAEIARSISQHPAAWQIYERTGCPIDAIYPLAKIQWLKQNFDLPQDVKFISIKEYVLYRLTGMFVADWSLASATGLFDIKSYQWDQTALDLLNISPANLSELVPPRHRFDTWEKEIMAAVGLPPDTPLIIGGGDGPLASIGVGASASDTLAVNVGTSAAARSIISEARVDPQGRLWTYVADEGLWVIGGIVSSGGIVYDWFLKNLLSESGQSVHDYVDRLVSEVPPGAENLIFVPYLGGEQCPVWQPHTRGSFFGLDFRHTKGHLARAMLEGICRSIYRVAESIEALFNQQFSEIRVTGGLAASPAWLQIAADMFGTPIVVPETVEGSARGAAILGLINLGFSSSIDQLTEGFAARQTVYPKHERHTYYQKQYKRFQQILDFSRKL